MKMYKMLFRFLTKINDLKLILFLNYILLTKIKYGKKKKKTWKIICEEINFFHILLIFTIFTNIFWFRFIFLIYRIPFFLLYLKSLFLFSF
jgi:hypothetical protein